MYSPYIIIPFTLNSIRARKSKTKSVKHKVGVGIEPLSHAYTGRGYHNSSMIRDVSRKHIYSSLARAYISKIINLIFSAILVT